MRLTLRAGDITVFELTILELDDDTDDTDTQPGLYTEVAAKPTAATVPEPEDKRRRRAGFTTQTP